MIKKHKHYARPRKPFEIERIEGEKLLIKTYGLRSKKEIWRSDYFIDSIREKAKKSIINPEHQGVLLARLVSIGLIKEGAGIDDVLALTRENLFERRLQTLVFKKGLAKTVKEARQYVVHKKIAIGKRTVNVPGYVVKLDEESKISLIKKEKAKEKPAEIKEEIKEAAAEAKE